MGIPSDRRFLAVAGKRLVHLFPRSAQAARVLQAPPPAGGHAGVADGDVREPEPRVHRRSAVDRQHPGRVRPQPRDRQALRSSPTRPTTAGAARIPGTSGDSGCTRSSPRTAPRERSSCAPPSSTSARSAWCCWTAASVTAAKPCSATRATPAAGSPRPSATATRQSSARAAKTSPEHGPHLAPIRQRIESIFWTCKDLLTLERHGARTLAGLRERVLARFCCPRRSDHPQPSTRTPKPCLVNYCA